MNQDILNIMNDFPDATEEELQAVYELVPVKTFEKGTVLLEAGRVATEGYFVVQGLVRSYFIVDGEERTTQFFAENEPAIIMSSYVNQKPSEQYMSCVEDCKLAIMNFEKEKELYRRFPALESGCRMAIEDSFGKQQEQLAKYVISSPEVRYLHLLETNPELVERVPQYHLASYLGVKPESLSRIRKRVSQKQSKKSVL